MKRPEAREASLKGIPARVSLGLKSTELSRSCGTWLSRASTIVTTAGDT